MSHAEKQTGGGVWRTAGWTMAPIRSSPVGGSVRFQHQRSQTSNKLSVSENKTSNTNWRQILTQQRVMNSFFLQVFLLCSVFNSYIHTHSHTLPDALILNHLFTLTLIITKTIPSEVEMKRHKLFLCKTV